MTAAAYLLKQPTQDEIQAGQGPPLKQIVHYQKGSGSYFDLSEVRGGVKAGVGMYLQVEARLSMTYLAIR